MRDVKDDDNDKLFATFEREEIGFIGGRTIEVSTHDEAPYMTLKEHTTDQKIQFEFLLKRYLKSKENLPLVMFGNIVVFGSEMSSMTTRRGRLLM